MIEPLLTAAEVTKSYAGVQALRGASLALRAGEVHALVGENGAGKSTLVKILTGAVVPDGGEIRVGGRVVAQHAPAAAKAAGIAAIYQQPALFPELTVAENLALGAEPGGLWRRVDWRARRRRAAQLLGAIGARIALDADAGDLSMPEQQLVEIARALGADAKVLILDEPTASLSEDDARNLFRVVRDLRARGVGMIYISHRLEELPAIADRVTVLRDGRTIGTHDMADVDRERLIAMMVGRELSAVFPKRAVPIGAPALELRGVGCAASGVRDVTLTVRAGEIVGLAGLVGAGRTELARTIFGLTPADAGEVRVRGRLVRVSSPTEAIALGVAYVPEDRRRHGVVPGMAVRENVTLAALGSISRVGRMDFGRERVVAADYVRRLGVKTSSIHAPVASLSGGNQQKVALSRWLVTRPSVLVLDEPTQGIDVGAKAEIHALMVDLAAQGVAILMISSELPEILGMSDRIAVMRGGTIVETFDGADATQERVLALALGDPARESTGTMDPGVRRGDAEAVGSPPAVTPPPVTPPPVTPPPVTPPPVTPAPVTPAPVTPAKAGVHRVPRELPPALALAALLLAVAFAAPAFFAPTNLRDLALNAAPVLVVAVGMTLVILAGEIDISVGSQFAVCSVLAGVLAKAGVPVALLPACLLAIGASLGLVNGLLVGALGLPSIIVTLAMLVAWRDALRWITEGAWVQGLPASFQWFGLAPGAAQAVVVGVAIGVTAAGAWALRHLAAGRAVYAVGSDAEAARLAGIDPQRVVVGVFAATGALVGLAATLNAVRFTAVPGNAGAGLELKAVAAVVVGGAAITGGRGTVLGTLLGVALLGAIGTALTFVGINPFWEKAIQGAVILAALASDAVVGRIGSRRRVRVGAR